MNEWHNANIKQLNKSTPQKNTYHKLENPNFDSFKVKACTNTQKNNSLFRYPHKHKQVEHIVM